MKDITITLNNGRVVNLTPDESRELYEKLAKIHGPPVPPPQIPVQPSCDGGEQLWRPYRPLELRCGPAGIHRVVAVEQPPVVEMVLGGA